MITLTDINGIRVGHAHDLKEGTGCSAILFDNAAVAGIDIRGSAPGTREAAMLSPTFMIRRIHAIMLTGGSAFGLRTADGAMRYLSENGIGYQAPGAVIPIVPAAVIYDMYPGRNAALPDVDMGYQACANARIEIAEGNVGAGTGAKVGKIFGLSHAMQGGLATAGKKLPNGVTVAALAVVNALGDVIDPSTGQIAAGARSPDTGQFIDSYRYVCEHGFPGSPAGGNTTLAVVATDAAFTKEEITKVAMMAQNGIGRSTRPAHTMHDGDMVFSVSCGEKKADLNVIGAVAAEMTANAIVRAVHLTNGKG